MRSLWFLLCVQALSGSPGRAEIWRDSQIPYIMMFGALDFKHNLCADDDVPGCKKMYFEMARIEREIRADEKRLYSDNMSKEQATKFIDYKIKNAGEIISFFDRHQAAAANRGQGDFTWLIGRLKDKIKVVLTEIISPKKIYIENHPEMTDYNQLLFGRPSEAEVVMSEKMQKTIYNVIVYPGIGTVHGVVGAAQESHKLYMENKILDQIYYQKSARKQIFKYYKIGSDSWDSACWICGRRHYVSAAHNMMTFGLLLGGASKTRFAIPAKQQNRGTASGK